MSKESERNDAAKQYVNDRLHISKEKSEKDFSELIEQSNYPQLLTDLIEVKAKGFRGVVVTALTGMSLSSDYNPLENFYGCHPRSIFEQGIFYALQENRIPCGKSDPLNVAKNINKLNEDWAEGKRPKKAASAAVRFLQLVLAATNDERETLINYFFFRLWRYAKKIQEYDIVRLDTSSSAKLEIGQKLISFTLNCPESGHLPQFLVSKLLQANFKGSDVTVFGGEESVFGTNTTSKKPADLWLKSAGQVTNLYEVTVKGVSQKRLDDCIDALKQTGYPTHSVTFICRLPEDTADLKVVNNICLYKNKRFGFIDYSEFCLALFALLPEAEVASIQHKMFELIRDVNISMKAKEGWNALFEKT